MVLRHDKLTGQLQGLENQKRKESKTSFITQTTKISLKMGLKGHPQKLHPPWRDRNKRKENHTTTVVGGRSTQF